MRKEFWKKRHMKYRTELYYTVLCILLMAAIFGWFVWEGRAMIWEMDGIKQHYNALLYERTWLRRIASTLLREHRLEIPMWDMKIGYGADILTTFQYYGLADPLNLPVALVPKASWVDEYYQVILLFRIYLSGLAFTFYCRNRGRKGVAVIFGALIYAFSAWTMVGLRHPFFLNPLVYFPILLAGADRIFQKRKPWLYMVTLTVILLSNFYFAYMICLLLIAYAIGAYFILEKRFRIKTMLYWLFSFLGYSLISFATASCIFLPVVKAVLSTGRLGAENTIPPFYQKAYYARVIVGFLTGYTNPWTCMGYTALGVLGIFTLFFWKKKNYGLKIAFVLMTILLLVPYMGHLMNGGSYVANRYMWAYAMLIAYILVVCYEDMITMVRERTRLFLGMMGIYIVACCLIGIRLHNRSYCGQALLLAICVGVAVCYAKRLSFSVIHRNRVLCGILVLSLVLQGWTFFSPFASKSNLREYLKKDTAYQKLTTQNAASMVKTQKDDSFYRYDQQMTRDLMNAGLQNGLNGTSFYFSLANGKVHQFQRELEFNTSRDYCYKNLDGRDMLDALLSVKYFVAPAKSAHAFPYLYHHYALQEKTFKNKKEGKKRRHGKRHHKKETLYGLHKSAEFLPFGFTSDRMISVENYQKMTAVQRQQALLQGIVVEDSSLPSAKPVFLDQTIPYTMEAMGDGIEIKDHAIVVRKRKAKLKLHFSGLPNSETYLRFQGLDWQGSHTQQLRCDEYKTRIKIKRGKRDKKELVYRSKESSFYCGVHDFLVNMCFSRKPCHSLTLTFSKVGTYRFDKLEVICQPLRRTRNRIRHLKENTLENLQVESNRIQGTLHLDQNKLLCMTIPYSKGWHAFVDGQEVQVKQADTAFMAIEVGAGDHKITWRYCTPYLKEGCCLTVFGIFAWLGLAIGLRGYGRRKKHKDGN